MKDGVAMREKCPHIIKSLQSRNETLLKVATCIVERQQGFLEHGEEAMKALVLHDVAEAVGMQFEINGKFFIVHITLQIA